MKSYVRGFSFTFMVGVVAAACSSDSREAGRKLDSAAVVVPDIGWPVDLPLPPDLTDPVDTAVFPSCVHAPVTKECSNGWCKIPPGCFVMGSPATEPCSRYDETQHQVRLTRAFEISEDETTQAEFEDLIGYNPTTCGTCDNFPVNSVSWSSAAAYCNALSSKQGLTPCYACTGTVTKPTCFEEPAYEGKGIYDCPGYRLPTEAEWEYAYRAGTTTALHNGAVPDCEDLNTDLDAIGWYKWNASGALHATMLKQPNGWGLYDMAGNVAEWVNDYYVDGGISGSQVDPSVAVPQDKQYAFRRLRNGSYKDYPKYQRAAARDSEPGAPGWVQENLGFRCARTLPPAP
jgi:formylglycine-generating enzyme required for sulfatase activity